MLLYSQILKADVPIIKNITKIEEIDVHSPLKNNLTNDYTNGDLGLTYAKNKNNQNEEEDKNDINNENGNKNNHEVYKLRSTKYNTTNTIIEVELPNPYLITEDVKNHKYVNYNVTSKFKSKFADYIKSQRKNGGKANLRSNKTMTKPKKFDKYIYFTDAFKQKKGDA